MTMTNKEYIEKLKVLVKQHPTNSRYGDALLKAMNRELFETDEPFEIPEDIRREVEAIG